MTMLFRVLCTQCAISFWNVPGNGCTGDDSGNYCQVCTINWDRRIYESGLAMLAHSLSTWHANINEMIMFGAGSLDPLALQRVDKRAAMYVVLVSRGSLLRMLSKEWDRSDTGLVEFRRNLLEDVVTYLA